MSLDLKIPIDRHSLDGYNLFLKCKRLPQYKVIGDTVYTDAISHSLIFGSTIGKQLKSKSDYLFDYQKVVTDRALYAKSFGVYMDCGLGKTAIECEFANRVAEKFGKVLFLCPLSVIEDVQRFSEKYYGYRMSNLRNEEWKTDVAILNWESMKEIKEDFTGIVLDEGSILKNDSGAIRNWLIQLSARCKYRLTASATPSPNEHAEYANQAVFLGVFQSAKEFYSKYFRKEGNDYILKAHAVERFYSDLKVWACYLHHPSKLGYDSVAEMHEEPIYTEMRFPISQGYMGTSLFTTSVSLQESRSIFGKLRADVNEERFRGSMKWLKGKQALIWCTQNAEQETFHSHLKGSKVVDGSTPIDERVKIVDEFRSGKLPYLISKPKVLGWGVNIPECNYMLYSGYNWSFESFYQAVRRSHRFGRKGRLEVMIPLTDPETPIWNDLTAKLKRFTKDVEILQEYFQ